MYLKDIGGLLYYLFQGDHLGIFPPLIFLGVGAMTDFGPLIANPKSLLLGAAAQFGIYITFAGAIAFGFTAQEASAIGIIGGADGPTAIFLASKLAPAKLGAIAVAAYSYMALVPVIQPPIMKALTTKKEREIKMEQLRVVSKLEKIIFPIIVTILVALIVPPATALVGMLMLGNLFKESGVVGRLTDTAQNALMNIVTIFLGVTVGATASAEYFLQAETLKIISLGIVAFGFGTAAGVLLAKLMNKLTGGKLNPLIGSAGVSAVPMAARVSQVEGQKADPSNFLLMHAMGPNVAGVIGSAVSAGVLLSLFG
jgi:oxaloacetate decarboxylase beta subunit